MDADEVERILNDASHETDLGIRLERISECFLGRPYVTGSLGGGPELPEVFRVSLAAFDCVTYMETVLAFALARTIDEFFDTIRRIRYADGKIDWFHRNHYMVDWARNNDKGGFVANCTGGPGTVQKTCRLELIPGFAAKTVSFQYFPQPTLRPILSHVESGDLILFVSEKETLDVFHTGLLINLKRQVLLRHATRTAGAVIEQDLIDFVRKNSMAGFILLRPICQR
jgi:hypothetical protein